MTEPLSLWDAWVAAELAYRAEADKYFAASSVSTADEVVGSSAVIDETGMARLAELRMRLTVAQTSYAATRLIAEAKPPATEPDASSPVPPPNAQAPRQQ